jgi:hypothetical protein
MMVTMQTSGTMEMPYSLVAPITGGRPSIKTLLIPLEKSAHELGTTSSY